MKSKLDNEWKARRTIINKKSKVKYGVALPTRGSHYLPLLGITVYGIAVWLLEQQPYLTLSILPHVPSG